MNIDLPMNLITAISCSVFAMSSVSTQDTERPQQPAEEVSPPRDITLETLADEDALRTLQAPGERVFEDDFESEASLEKYFELQGRKQGKLRLITDEELAHGGHGALRLDAPENDGAESGSGAVGWLGAEGHDRIYFRRYIRFAADYDQGNLNHTGGGLAGVAGTGKWDGMGKAGVRPVGDDRFTSSFEPWRDWGRSPAPGYMCLYTYWMDMQPSRGDKWWGNLLQPPEKRRRELKRDEWICLEQMISVNTIGEADGELAAWIDGELYLHLTGFRWRTDERLKIKRFRLGIYVHEARKDNTVWYDDVVLSTGYIGPVPAADEAGEAVEELPEAPESK